MKDGDDRSLIVPDEVACPTCREARIDALQFVAGAMVLDDVVHCATCGGEYDVFEVAAENQRIYDAIVEDGVIADDEKGALYRGERGWRAYETPTGD